jgi:DNA-binding transcriptional LysR family regulator
VELRNIRTFLAVADERHFGRAAAILNITQPALTQRIQALEQELGIQLLRRNAREVRLTPAGEALLEHARRLVKDEDRALREMRDHTAGVAGRLRISYLTSWTVGIPANIVSEFRRRYPAVRLETSSGMSQSNVQRLIADDLDFTFIRIPTVGGKGVVVRAINRQEVLLVMTPTNHLAPMERVPVECLRGEPIISVSSLLKSPHLDAALKWFAAQLGEEPNIIAEEPIDQIPAAVAESGIAIAFTTDTRVSAMKAAGLICRPMIPAPIVEYGIAYHDANPSPALANLLTIVDEVVPNYPGDLPTDGEVVSTVEDIDHEAADTPITA